MSGFYKLPEASRNWTDEQRRSYIFGRQQDAHVRRWHAARLLKASDHITTESLLSALLGPR